MIHEIQHILSSYHKFHPYIHNVWSVFGGEFESLLSKGEDVSEEDVKNLLKKEGFDDASAKELAETYAWRYKNDYEHLQRQEEATSALFEIRHALKLQPGQEITKQILIQNATKDSVEWFLNLWIFSGKSLDEFLKKQNTIALNQTKTSSDTGIA